MSVDLLADATSPVGPRSLTRHRQVCLPRQLMNAVGISLCSSVTFESAPEGILVTAEPGAAEDARRVLSSGQVVIPKKMLEAHAIKESGRVYIARSKRKSRALLIISEAQVAERLRPALVAQALQR